MIGEHYAQATSLCQVRFTRSSPGGRPSDPGEDFRRAARPVDQAEVLEGEGLGLRVPQEKDEHPGAAAGATRALLVEGLRDGQERLAGAAEVRLVRELGLHLKTSRRPGRVRRGKLKRRGPSADGARLAGPAVVGEIVQ